ncbi:MAG TPA: hypothetical protein ENL04_00315 [Sulfuricurvum sp.]|nr:hypothetical protein [Sulfuricurvum sp.]
MAMRLLWDTFDPNVNGYLHRGDHINFVVKIDDAAAMNTAFELLSMHAGSGGISLLLESPALSDTLISRLKQGYEIRFEITGSRGFVNTFDLKSDYFSLSGFTAAYRVLKQRCKILKKEQ